MTSQFKQHNTFNISKADPSHGPNFLLLPSLLINRISMFVRMLYQHDTQGNLFIMLTLAVYVAKFTTHISFEINTVSDTVTFKRHVTRF